LSAYASFAFTRRAIDGRRIRLGYALGGGERGDRVELEETLDLPESLGPLADPGSPAVRRALVGLHLAAGTSYWKTFIPADLRIDDAELSSDDAAFWSSVYTLGMAEFFYKNGIDPRGRAPFGATRAEAAPAPAVAGDGPWLLLWGGGKDSVVSHEVLAAAGERHELLTIGREEWAWPRRAAEVAGATLHVVERRLDEKLFALNAAGALNGHVPVNAYLAVAGTLIAQLTRRRGVIASNEASASAGNAVWHGIDVNHQWSKSLAFERLFRAWLRRNLDPAPEYFSLLRPLSELRIVRAFASHPEYFGAVTSCNANFAQSGPAANRWCLRCPKCVFVAAMARPWLDDRAYHALLGGDPLSDPANVSTLEELLGITGTKPFECVGTPEEMIAALYLAHEAGRPLSHGAATAFGRHAAAKYPDLETTAAGAMARSDDHELPPTLLEGLDAYLRRR